MYIPWVYSLDDETLLKKTLPKRLKAAGYTDIMEGDKFLYARGEVPIMLNAHVDTVHHSSPPTDIFYDKKKQVLWSPDGIGGDDRAGVSIIVRVLEEGLKPHVLITDEEERGAQGAREAIRVLDKPDPKDLHYVIGLDRKGASDACFYSCNNKKFKEYVEEFGFARAMGSMSDISVLCPEWDIAGVNLSVGYIDNHLKTERVYLQVTELTLFRVLWMLQTKSEPFDMQQPKTKVIPYRKTTATKTPVRKPALSAKGTGRQWGNNTDYYGYTDDYYEDSAYATSAYSKTVNIIVDLQAIADAFGGARYQWAKWFRESRKEIEDALDLLARERVYELAEAAAVMGEIKGADSLWGGGGADEV